jgi:hypothetical protein
MLETLLLNKQDLVGWLFGWLTHGLLWIAYCVIDIICMFGSSRNENASKMMT